MGSVHSCGFSCNADFVRNPIQKKEHLGNSGVRHFGKSGEVKAIDCAVSTGRFRLTFRTEIGRSSGYGEAGNRPPTHRASVFFRSMRNQEVFRETLRIGPRVHCSPKNRLHGFIDGSQLLPAQIIDPDRMQNRPVHPRVSLHPRRHRPGSRSCRNGAQAIPDFR